MLDPDAAAAAEDRSAVGDAAAEGGDAVDLNPGSAVRGNAARVTDTALEV